MASDTARLDVQMVGHDKVSPAARQASKSINDLSLQTQALGSAISGFAARQMVDFLGDLSSEFFAQERAAASVEIGVARIGDKLGYTVDEVKAFASEMQNVTIFGDEEILQKVTAQVLSFPSIVGEEFMRAQQSILDIATLTGNDLQSVALAVAKALADPKGGIGAMKRFGVTITEQQKEIVQGHVESNNQLAAQAELLDIIESQYDGIAEYIALTQFGAWEKFKNDIGDLKEVFGEFVVEGLDPTRDRISSLAEEMRGWDDDQQRLVSRVLILGTTLLGATAFVYGFATALKAMRAASVGASGRFGILATVVVVGGTIIMDQLGLVGDEFLSFEDKVIYSVGRVFEAVGQAGVGVVGILGTAGAAVNDLTRSVDDLFMGRGFQSTATDEYLNNIWGPAAADFDKWMDRDLHKPFRDKSEENRLEQEEMEKRMQEMLDLIAEAESEDVAFDLPEKEKTRGRRTEKEAALFAVLANLLTTLIGETEEGNEILRHIAMKLGVSQKDVIDSEFASVVGAVS